MKKIFSSVKKHKKSDAIGFESVPLNIKIGVFLVKKGHTFSGFPHIVYLLNAKSDTFAFNSKEKTKKQKTTKKNFYRQHCPRRTGFLVFRFIFVIYLMQCLVASWRFIHAL